jgi:hypothetical protein
MINTRFTNIRIEHWISLFISAFASDDNDSKAIAF